MLKSIKAKFFKAKDELLQKMEMANKKMGQAKNCYRQKNLVTNNNK